MDNKLIATVDIGSHSCILLIAAFEDDPACHPELYETRQLVAKVELCPLGRNEV